MDKGRFLGLRLFLEGIEVDVVSAVVSAGINTSATAVIDIPACDAAHRLEPRTLVHLFYIESSYNLVSSDEGAGTPSTPTRTGTIEGTEEPRVNPELKTLNGVKTLDTADLSNWRLLFAGEVLGYAYSKVGAFRQIALQCQDFTSYWQQSKLYWGKSKVSANSYKKTVFTGATHLHVGKRPAENSGALLRLLTSRPSTIPKLPGILGGVVNLLESAVGVYDSTARKRYRGVNDFMTQAELRLRLTRTIAASPDDDTSAQFLNTKGFRRYLRQVSRRVKSTASYLDLAQVFLGKCYHQWASLTAPPFIVAGQQEATVQYLVATGVKFRDPQIASVYGDLDKVYRTVNKRMVGLLETADKMQSNNLSDTKDPHKHRVSSAGDKTEVDVAGVQSFSKDTDLASLWGKDFGVGSPVRESLKPGDAAHAGFHDLERAQKIVEKSVRPDKGLSPDAKPTDVAMTATKVRELNGLLENAKRELAKKGGGKVKRVVRKIKLNSRLHMSLFTPDIYMVPPPTCNVLFPDHYSSISFSRAWMSEVTRLWLHGRSETGRDKKNMYFSPNTDILTSDKYNFDATKAVKKGISFIMQHERFTGIVPAIEGLGDNDIFARLHKKTVKSGRKNRKERKQDAKEGRDMAGQAIFSPQEHLQRAANYLFFAKRYARRVMNITARFSPQLIVGVPCLVLDPMKGQRSRFANPKAEIPTLGDINSGQVDPNVLRGTQNRPIGTHYVGVVTNIRHQLDASGGALTTVQLTKCRAHNEGVDLFKEPDDDGYASIEKIKRRRVKRKVAQGVVTRAGVDSEGNAIINQGVDEANIEYRGEDGFIKFKKFQRKRGKSYTLSVTQFGEKDEIATNFAPATLQRSEEGDSFEQPPDRHGLSFATKGDGSEAGFGVYVDINEAKTVTNKIPVKFSFEGTTTPPWFAPIYMPAAIGRDFYQKMFGCDSVLDSGLLAEFGSQGDDVVATPGQMHTVAFETNDSSGVKEISIPSDLVNPAVTVKRAAEVLSEFWLGLTEIGADVDLFIDVYTKRKYANILEVLGNTNPDMLVTAHNGIAPKVGDTKVDGFHGNAFGRQTNFDGFPEYEPLAMPEAGRSNPNPKKRLINPKLDTRKAKYNSVLRYKNEISSLGANNVYGFGKEESPAPVTDE